MNYVDSWLKQTSISRLGALAAAAIAPAALAGCAPAAQSGSPAPGSSSPSSTASVASSGALSDASGSSQAESPTQLLANMSLEQRVGQLFMVRPEQLAGEASRLAASSQLGAALERFPVGGVCLFSQNMQTAQQVEDFLAQAHSCWRNAGIPSPFLAVDEEGGDLVARVANSGLFNVGRVPNMGEVGASGDPARGGRGGCHRGISGRHWLQRRFRTRGGRAHQPR